MVTVYNGYNRTITKNTNTNMSMETKSMRHVSLTCINHPKLRWQCKEIAVNEIGQYNGSRNIFYLSDEPECMCPPSDLRFSPEELERQKTEPLGESP